MSSRIVPALPPYSVGSTSLGTCWYSDSKSVLCTYNYKNKYLIIKYLVVTKIKLKHVFLRITYPFFVFLIEKTFHEVIDSLEERRRIQVMRTFHSYWSGFLKQLRKTLLSRNICVVSFNIV